MPSLICEQKSWNDEEHAIARAHCPPGDIAVQRSFFLCHGHQLHFQGYAPVSEEKPREKKEEEENTRVI